jgi:hypothetical protein
MIVAGFKYPGVSEGIAVITGSLGFVAIVWLLFDARRKQRTEDHRRRHGLCLTCGYDMTGNVRNVCPECGYRRGRVGLE